MHVVAMTARPSRPKAPTGSEALLWAVVALTATLLGCDYTLPEPPPALPGPGETGPSDGFSSERAPNASGGAGQVSGPDPTLQPTGSAGPPEPTHPPETGPGPTSPPATTPTALPPVSGVEATEGGFSTHVLLRWSPVPGATGYEVYRDGIRITPTPLRATQFEDRTGPDPPPPPRVTGVQASTDRPWDVRVTWEPVTPPPGPVAQYTVRAIRVGETGPESAPVSGWRAAPPITGYVVFVEGEEDDPFVTTETLWDDNRAPEPAIVGGQVSASQSDSEAIGLSVTGVGTMDGSPRVYRVAARTAQATGAPSAPAIGQRTAGPLLLQWEWSEAGPAEWSFADGTWPGPFTHDLRQPWAPAPEEDARGGIALRAGEARPGQDAWVRLVLDVGADAEVRFRHRLSPRSCCERMTFLVDGAVRGTWEEEHPWTEAVLPLAPGRRSVEWRFTRWGDDWNGVDAWIDDVRISQTPDWSPLNAANELSATDSSPGAGVLRFYRVRATAPGASAWLSAAHPGVRPLPGPSEWVTASMGSFEDRVRLHWSPVPGADGYQVDREGQRLTHALLTDTAFDDHHAPPPPEPGEVRALQATGDRDAVRLTWSPLQLEQAPGSRYTVTAVFGDRETAPSVPVVGYRATTAIDAYSVEVNGTWRDVGVTAQWTHTQAPRGTLSVGAPSASTTLDTGVDLSVPAATTTPGALQTYRVRADLTSGAQSLPSIPASSRRTVGSPTYQWQWSSTQSGPWTNLGSATARTGRDTTIALGEVRWYRVRVSAAGAADVTSAATVGERVRLVRLGQSCTQTSQCGTSEWCPTNTTSANRRCAPRPPLGGASMPFQHIPSGSFTMGSPQGEPGRQASREGQVNVTLTRAFYLQRTETTQGQWRALSGGLNPSTHTACGDDCPVNSVSWWSTLWFANALSDAEGLAPCYVLPANCTGEGRRGTLDCGDGMPAVNAANVYACTGYRLPTEAEWEYAARAGETRGTQRGDLVAGDTGCNGSRSILDPIVWYCGNSAVTYASCGDRSDEGGPACSGIQRVALLAPNAWGLYDMLGNVGELTWDRFHEALPGGTNPRREGSGPERTTRGGDYWVGAFASRNAHRWKQETGDRFANRGVRLARSH